MRRVKLNFKPWLFRGKPFTKDMVTEDMAGFVYEIINNVTGVKYLGKKVLWGTQKLPPLKGYKRNRLVTKQSDWERYWGSSKYVTQSIVEHGYGNFTRNIILFGDTRSVCNYAELILQVQLDVLHAEMPNGDRVYANENIDRIYYASNTPAASVISDASASMLPVPVKGGPQ